MACGDCDFVIVDGVSLPGVSAIEERPVYIGDAERSVSGVLRPNFRTVAREWTVLLSGVSGVETRLLEEHLRTLGEVLVNVQGVECFALVTVNSKVRVPRLSPSTRGPRDLVRTNWEILIRETQVETVLPGVSYAYQAFTSVGAFTWDWDAAGQPAQVDILLVGGGGGGGSSGTGNQSFYNHGLGGGGAGGVITAANVPVSGNLTGFVGAGGVNDDGEDTTLGSLTAVGGGAGAGVGGTSGGAGGSGGGARQGGTPGAGTDGQGQPGGRGSSTSYSTPNYSVRGGAGGGGGAGAPGAPGENAMSTPIRSGVGGAGGTGIDLLSLGWNYRLIEGVPRFIGGGGGGSGGVTLNVSAGEHNSVAPGAGGIGGGGAGGQRIRSTVTPAGDGQPNTGGGGGGGVRGDTGGIDPVPPGSGGSGLVIVRWLVSA